MFPSESSLLHNNLGRNRDCTVHVAGLRNTTQHTSAQEHGAGFDVYFWKRKSLLFRRRRRAA